jgi:hypothetical protein
MMLEGISVVGGTFFGLLFVRLGPRKQSTRIGAKNFVLYRFKDL